MATCPRNERYKKHIETDEVEFHMQLIQSILDDLVVPTHQRTELESIFKPISYAVAQTQNTSESLVFWSLIQVFTYNEIRDDIQAIVVGKGSHERISVEFFYKYGDYNLNENTIIGVKKNLKLVLTSILEGSRLVIL
ncbi:hypothetical protein BOTNAR_0234g00180 [Botryotinia narcissicola]|uniref:Uncharacterized protein n=1 Tax=Botryotinia narcissicola TaxID=278944 RepID=A0A4Z1IH10_9HELO|nr:hypothetical protein BOTNAR_0234g00180 [Botryotinia narcissicola]